MVDLGATDPIEVKAEGLGVAVGDVFVLEVEVREVGVSIVEGEVVLARVVLFGECALSAGREAIVQWGVHI